jgi:hypothetical protein
MLDWILKLKNTLMYKLLNTNPFSSLNVGKNEKFLYYNKHATGN